MGEPEAFRTISSVPCQRLVGGIHVNLLKLCFVVLKRTECMLEACRREKKFNLRIHRGCVPAS